MSVYDFRTNLATYLDLVKSSGVNVVVKRFNKPVAMLSPYRKDKLDFGPFWGFMKGRRETGIAFENRVRRSVKEKAWVKRAR